MYGPVKRLALRILRAPSEPPETPPGSHDSVQVFRASPRYLTYRMLGFWVHAVFLILVELAYFGGSIASGRLELSLVGGVVAVVLFFHLCIQYVATRMDFELRYYIVTDRAVRVRQGAWLVREMTITHANVQNLRVVQGPIQRLFRIANLEIDTAGGGGAQAGKGHAMLASHTVHFAGIENAHEVRDIVLAHLRARGGGTGLGDVDDHAERAPQPAPAAPAMLDVLREVRDAARGLRAAAEARASK
jgi:membrane protein YdbS with pleckstrin-like domain